MKMNKKDQKNLWKLLEKLKEPRGQFISGLHIREEVGRAL